MPKALGIPASYGVSDSVLYFQFLEFYVEAYV